MTAGAARIPGLARVRWHGTGRAMMSIVRMALQAGESVTLHVDITGEGSCRGWDKAALLVMTDQTVVNR